MNCIDNRLQFFCALRSCSFSYLRILQFVRVSEMFSNSACWPQSSSVALCNAYTMGFCECQYHFQLSTRPPTEGEREREHILHNIQDSVIPWLPSRLEFSTIFSLHSTVWIFQAAKEQSYWEQAVRPQTEQIALLWKQIQAEYLNEKWSFCLSRVAGSWGHIDRETDTRVSASGVREDRHFAIRNCILAQTCFLDEREQACMQGLRGHAITYTHSDTIMTLSIYTQCHNINQNSIFLITDTNLIIHHLAWLPSKSLSPVVAQYYT